jgi:DNA-binding LacI/PurR family transcriptional regulator
LIAQRIAAMGDDRPTGFIVSHESVTIGFHHGLNEVGLVPGRDVALIGRGGLHARYLLPKLTNFSLSLRDLGISLAESLLATMARLFHIYPLGVVRRVVPFDSTEGDSDATPLAGTAS